MDNRIFRILEKGILAPSADNLQPWRFKISPSYVDVSIKEEGSKILNAGYRFTFFSVGSVIENMRVAAASEGLKPQVTYFPSDQNETLVARVRFEEVSKTIHPHEKAIDSRVTNRRFYEPAQQITEKDLNSLKAGEGEFKEGRILWLSKSGSDSKYATLSKLLGQMDRLRFETKQCHEELIPTLRFTPEEVQRRDGLDIETLEAPAGHLLFNLIRTWNRMKFLNKLGLSYFLSQNTVRQMQSSSACALLTLKDSSPENFVRAGEFMQHLWHEMTLRQMAIQPMMAYPIFMNYLNLEGSAFSGDQKKTLALLDKSIREIFQCELSEIPAFLFRMGYGATPTARSFRRPLEKFVISEN